jgi:hypothetical protein
LGVEVLRAAGSSHPGPAAGMLLAVVPCRAASTSNRSAPISGPSPMRGACTRSPAPHLPDFIIVAEAPLALERVARRGRGGGRRSLRAGRGQEPDESAYAGVGRGAAPQLRHLHALDLRLQLGLRGLRQERVAAGRRGRVAWQKAGRLLLLLLLLLLPLLACCGRRRRCAGASRAERAARRAVVPGHIARPAG